MIEILKDLQQIGDWNEMRKNLGNLLGLNKPVSSAVLSRARMDDNFAIHLFKSADDLDLLQLFLDDTENDKYELIDIPKNQTNSELVMKASNALWNWKNSGFEKVSSEVYSARISNCNSCDYVKDAPDKLVYKVKLKKESDSRICGACGCGISRKAWLPTETCPIENPLNFGFNLWNEKVKTTGKLLESNDSSNTNRTNI